MVIVTRSFGKISSMRAQAYRSSSGVDTALPVDIQLAAELALLDVFFDIDSPTTVCLRYFEDASQTSGGLRSAA